MYTEQEYKTDIDRLNLEYNSLTKEYTEQTSSKFTYEQKFLSYMGRLSDCYARYNTDNTIDNCPKCNSKRRPNMLGYCCACNYNPNP